MPKTKFQDIIFSIMMVIVMVYAMVCYNIAFAFNQMSNQVFLLALNELPIMALIAFAIEFLFVGNLTKKIAFKNFDVKNTNKVILTVFISCLTVAFMCPIMSMIATLLFNFNGIENIIATWMQTVVKNFPMALFFQLFVAGPLVRFIFSKIFK